MLQHNINIAIKGQIVGTGGADDTGLVIIYTASPETDHIWTRSLFDPRDARNFTAQDQDAFAFWNNSDGNFYAIIFPSNDGRNGRLMLVINVKGFMSQEGNKVIDTLRSLKDYYNRGQLTGEIAPALLISFDNSLIKDNSYDNRLKYPTTKGYRIFLNDENLYEMFTYPHQAEYADYKCVYFVPNEQNQPDPNFRKITGDVKVMYQIVSIPDNVDVEPSRRSVQKGGTLTITYKKDGCQEEKRIITIQGASSFEPAITYSGNSIRINDAKTLGIKFMRKVYIDFVEEGTNSRVRNVTIINERNQKQVTDFILLPESDTRASFKIEASGYEKSQVQLNSTDISSGRTKVELKPKMSQRDITIILPDGNRSRIRAKVKDGDPLASYLDMHMSQLVISRKGYGGVTPPPYGGVSDGEDKQSWWKQIPIWLWCSMGFLTAFLLCCLWLFHIWPFNGKDEPAPADEQKIEQVDTTRNDTLLAENKQADIDYLKKNDDNWDKSQLKTEEYLQLMDYINQGQFEEAFNHSYKDENRANGYWKTSVAIYTEIKGKVDDSKIRGALTRAKVDYNKISVKKLCNELTVLKNEINQQPSTGSTFSTTTNHSTERNSSGTTTDKTTKKKTKQETSDKHNAGATGRPTAE